jgi:hypothetical protein
MAKTEPNSGIQYGWERGESGWGTAMNENLVATGSLLHHTAISLVDAPPSSPSNGDIHLVGETPSGAFSGQDGKVAVYVEDTWKFFVAKGVFDVDGVLYRSEGGQWVVLELALDNIADESITQDKLSSDIQEKLEEPAVTIGAGLEKDNQGRIRVKDSYIIGLVGGGGGPGILDESSFSYNHSDGSYNVDNVRATSVHAGMKRCVVEDDGTIAYFLDPYDSTKKENGSPAVLDGTDGQVMVRIPKFYANRFVDGNVETWHMSAEPRLGLVLHPAFYANDGTTELDYILVGAYLATLWSNSSSAIIDGLNLDNNSTRTNQTNDKLSSTSGNYVFVGRNRAEFRQLARNRGVGWSQWDYYTWQAILFLFYTEYGNLNSQDALGDGNVWRSYTTSSSNQANSPHVINGVSNSLGNQSGAVEDTNKNDTGDWSGNPFVSYRGIENLWGNSWSFIDGCYLSSYGFYVTGNQTKFADSTSNHSKLGSNVPSTPYSPIGRFQNLGSPLMLVGSIGGDTDTYVGDSFWGSNSTRIGRVGGGSSEGLHAGGSALNLSTPDSGYYRSIGARLMYKG